MKAGETGVGMTGYAVFQMWEPFRQALIKGNQFYVEQAQHFAQDTACVLHLIPIANRIASESDTLQSPAQGQGFSAPSPAPR